MNKITINKDSISRLYLHKYEYEEIMNLVIKKQFKELLILTNLKLQHCPKHLDWTFLKAFCLYSLQSYEEARWIFQEAVLITETYHCFYHYQGRVLFHNLGNRLREQGDEVGSLKAYKRADFLYHWDADCKKAIEDLNFIPIDVSTTDEDFYNKKGFYKDKNVIIFEGNRFTGRALDWNKIDLNLCQKLCNLHDKQHFEYHCNSALIYYYCGINFKELGYNDVALANLNRAIEFDKNNHNNDLYFSVKQKIEQEMDIAVSLAN